MAPNTTEKKTFSPEKDEIVIVESDFTSQPGATAKFKMPCVCNKNKFKVNLCCVCDKNTFGSA
jgi:hypothetical protein